MGNALESLSPRRGVKRSLEELEGSQEKDNGNKSSDTPGDYHTPKRKRSQSTAKYILKTLFEEGTESDITINACAHEWHLHKLYLCQCRYFDSMFNGPWREADQSVVSMEITDENIDHKALKIAFQSLYTDNVFVKASEAVGVLAAATLLQLDSLIEHCKTVMKGCIAPDTVCMFYKASERYGLVEIKDLCLKWLQHCLMVPGYATLICHIPEDLLQTLLSSPDLWLMQVEVDIYTLLKKWMFIQLNPSWNGSREQLYSDSEDYFKRRTKEGAFLETETGQRFIHMFKKIRWMYVINDLSSIQLLKDDKILPLEWLEPYLGFCWTHHLMVEQAIDKGPQRVSEEEFLEKSMRCGRILLQEQDYCWRWVGYNFGLDMLITCRNRVLMIKRNGGSQHFEGLISQQSQRHVLIRLSIATIRKNEPSPVVNTTGIKTLTLSPDEEVMLMQLSSEVKFPLQVTMNLLFVSPSDSVPWPSLAIPPPAVVSVPAQASSSVNTTTSASSDFSSCSMTSVDAATTEERSLPNTTDNEHRSVGNEHSCVQSDHPDRQRAALPLNRGRVRHRSGETSVLEGNSGTPQLAAGLQANCTRSALNQQLQPTSSGEVQRPGSSFVTGGESPSSVVPVSQPSSASSSHASSLASSSLDLADRSAIAYLSSIRGRESHQHCVSCDLSSASCSASPAAAAAVQRASPSGTGALRPTSKSTGRRRLPPHSGTAATQ